MRLSLIFLLTLINYNLFAQKNINGKVSDENNEGLPGATIIIKGTTKGTVSDINGIFMLDVNENDTITISFSGYIKQNIPVIGNISFSINLDPDVETLKEVVVVGYGSEQKINLTGSVATLKDQELTLAPVANSSNLLAGRVPGVMTRQNSGLPGGENTQIRIRSFSEAPLILVDGVQMDFSRIDQNDIASISVLKDASAAVYGARAGNGVVLVTTKRGESGKPKISYSSNLTLQSATAFLDHVSASQYVELVREANLNDFNDPNATFSEDDIKNYHSKTQGYEGGD
jgi:TonB-dependent SusC/RagA subfamily outer membrane receptor